MKKIFCLILIAFLISCNNVFAEIDYDLFTKSYSDYVQKLIKSNFKYDGEYSATAAVSYKIHPDGSVTDINIVQASNTPMDEALVNAVKKSAPFNPFPENSNLSFIKLTSGMKHTVTINRYVTPPDNTQSQQNIRYAGTQPHVRMAIQPVELSAEVQVAHHKYMEYISEYLFKRIPTTYSYIPKTPEIQCIILKDGSIKDFKLTQTSGIERYDNDIIKTFSGMKVPPFPFELNGFEELPFSMKVYGRVVPSTGLGGRFY